MKTSAWYLARMAFMVLPWTACGDDDVTRDASVDASVPASSMDGASPRLDAAATLDAGGKQAFTLRFKAKVGNADLVCGQSYEKQGSTQVTITPRDFRLFVQSVRLISVSGSEVPLDLDERLPFQSQGVALLDFTNGEGSCTSGDPSSNTLITGTAPAGDYTGVVFVNGVADALNHGDPTLAPAPLQAPGASWGWLSGYRFLMAEVLTVRTDPDAGLAAGSDAGFAADGGALPAPSGLGFVHLGSTGCGGTEASGITCANDNRSQVRLTGFHPATSVIVADLGAIFSTADLRGDVQCHGSGPACAPMFEALGVDLATGAALATQRVYHIE
ncbi:MAG: hypothetical protein JWN48_3919 [Myxococcaceae bacterium]|nr:hypothetical protein [Myxococcaceae bacterium]